MPSEICLDRTARMRARDNPSASHSSEKEAAEAEVAQAVDNETQ